MLALPLYHIFGLMMMLAYATIGARAVLIPNPRDMDGFIDAIKDAKLSVLPAVNTLFQGLTMHPRFKEIDLSNYKIAIGGGPRDAWGWSSGNTLASIAIHVPR